MRVTPSKSENKPPVYMIGVQQVHYDETLADGGLISDYKVVSWFEDDR